MPPFVPVDSKSGTGVLENNLSIADLYQKLVHFRNVKYNFYIRGLKLV